MEDITRQSSRYCIPCMVLGFAAMIGILCLGLGVLKSEPITIVMLVTLCGVVVWLGIRLDCYENDRVHTGT